MSLCNGILWYTADQDEKAVWRWWKYDHFTFILVTLLGYYKVKVNDKYLNKTVPAGKKDYTTKIMRFKQGKISLFFWKMTDLE